MADTELSKAVPASTENTASSSLPSANAVPLKKVNSKSTVSSVKSPVSALPNKSSAVTTSQSSKPTTPKTNVRPTITSVVQVVSLPKSSTIKGNLAANSKRSVSSLSNSRSASSEKIPTVEPVIKKAPIKNVVNVSSGSNSSTKSDAATKHNLDNVEKVSSSTDVVKDTKMGLDSKNAKGTGKQISLDTANKIDSKVKLSQSTETSDYIKVKVSRSTNINEPHLEPQSANNQLPGSGESLISIKSAEDVKQSLPKKPVADLSDLNVELKTNAKSRISCDTGVQELEDGFVCILSGDVIDELCIEQSEKHSVSVKKVLKNVNEKNSLKREMYPELNASGLSTDTLQECSKKELTGDLSTVVSTASNSAFGIPVGASISPACSVVSGSANGKMQPVVKNASVVKEQEVPKVKSSNAIDPTAAINVSDSLASKQVSSKPCDTSDSKTKSMTVESCNQLVNSSSSVETENAQSPNHLQISSQCSVDTKCDPVTTAIPPEETKQSIRLKVWDRLEKNNYVLFPRPCKGRIPHFVGSPEAAEKLATLENFKNAKNVKVNPDKPQAHIRFLTLEAGKNLLVPVPRLRSGLFKRIVPPAGATKEQLRTVVTQQGVVRFGQPLELNDKVSIDLVIMGAVAVSKEGHRIGKGEGYADLEFAIMMKMGAITKDTIVITTVHDEQVFDTLPNHLFKEHDVPVDFIVTPTQVYEVQPRLPKPSGIFWNILSNRRMQLIPILKTLREQEIAEGKECQLKEVDSDPEDRPVRPIRFFRRISRRRSQTQPKNQRPPRESSAPPATPNARPAQKSRQSRTFRRKPAAARSSSAKEQTTKPVESGNKSERKQQNMVERVRAGGDGVRPIRRRYYRPKTSIAFSIRVSGISQGTRVRDLKTALNERGVKPFDITWESSKGHAVLHFSRIDVGKDKTPQIISEISSVTTIEGFPAKLEVKLLGNAKHYKYEWFVNGNPVNVSAKHCRVISRIDGIAALIFGNVTLGDAGEYSVVIKNKQGEISSKGFLKVEEKTTKDIPESKPEFVKELEEVSADKNTPLAFYADIAGNPVPDVEWSKDGVVLAHNDWIQFLYERNKIGLKINQCRMSDAGVYTCKLTNSLGEANSSAKAIINTPSRLNQINNITKDITIAMDDIIAALQDLKVKGEGEEDPKDSLCVEPANPISRIESTGISAV